MQQSQEKSSYQKISTPFVTSEKVLANYAKKDLGIQMLFETDKKREESLSDDSMNEEEGSLFGTQRTKKKSKAENKNFKKQSIQSEILAARQSRGWQDFVKTGSVSFGITEEDRSKRVRRMLMIGQAINAYEDVPVQEPGQRFLQNSWG